MRRRQLVRVAVVAAAFAYLALDVSPVGAHRVPPNCNSNNLALNPSQDRLTVRNGDDITYTVTVSNVDSGPQIACNITNATVSLTLPAADGSPAGQKVTLASGVDYPAGTPLTVLGTVPYKVAVNPGVSSVVVKAEATGTLHDAPNDDMAAIVKTLSTTVTQPHTTLNVVARPRLGRVPLTVTYTYVEKNDSSTDAPISGVRLRDENCSPITFGGGDANSNEVLDTGETWTYTCTKTYTAPGSFVSDVTATGTNTVDGRAHPIERDRAAVTVTNPHTTLAVTATPTDGIAPLTVTYTYTEVNDGTDPISGVVIADDNCSPVTLTGGDANADAILDPGETWTFTCTRTFSAAGTFTSHVTGTGTDTVDSLAAPLETAQATVTVRPPPPVRVEAGPPVARRTRNGLPFTGFRLVALLALALALLAAGGLLVGAARRRRRAS